MSEIEKMYENARIKICKRKQGFTLKDCTDRDCKECRYYNIPPFTAEKQLELIKWLANIERNGDKDMDMTIYNNANHPYYYFCLTHNPSHNEDDEWCYGEGLGVTFEEGLARLIMALWQDLTEEEHKQIKDILE